MKQLAAVLAVCAFLALPAAAEAGSPIVDTGEGGKFVAGVTKESSFAASGEPTITCGSIFVTGEFLSGTTGLMALNFLECHIVVLGLTTKCKSAGSTTEGLIAIPETVFHTTYLTDNKTKPGLLLTPPFPTVTCGSAAAIRIEGIGLMGTLTGWECNKSVEKTTLSFVAEGATQEHQTITGTGSTVWSLEERTYTTKELAVKAGLNAEIPLSFGEGKTATLTCV